MHYQALRDLMDRLTAWRIPGNAAIGYRDGQEVFSYASGFANVASRQPMTADHFLDIYSCSKPATVAAALQLLERGYFLLDDPLYEFLPEYRQMRVRTQNGTEPAQNPITLRHLFTMTAGLDYNRDRPYFREAMARTQGRMETREVIRCLASEPLDFEPGTLWQYSAPQNHPWKSGDLISATLDPGSALLFPCE